MPPEWSELTAEIGAIAFVIAVFYLLFLPRGERFSRRAWPAWTVVVLFLGAVLWSMWNETLYPLIRAGETGHAVRAGLGLLGIVLALLLITYGGFGVFAGVLKAMHEETFVQNTEVVRAGAKRYPREVVRAARKENLRLIFRAARPGCLWMVVAFLLLALGAWVMR